MKLVQTAQISTALVYVIASNVFGIALAFAGYTLGLKLK
jgi:fluoride ion exporter CrcB/FEX